MAYAQKLKEQAHRLACDIQDIVNLAEKENDRGLTSDELVKFNKLVADHSAVEASIKVAETATDVASRVASADPKNSKIINILENNVEELQDTFRMPKPRADAAYNKAFSNYVRNGERTSVEYTSKLQGPGIQNAQTVTTTAGGYLVPAGFSDQLETEMQWFGGIDGNVEKIYTSSGNPMPYPNIADVTNKGRMLAINTQVTETDFVFGQVTFNAFVGSSDLVLVPIQLIEDSYFDINAMVAKMLGIRLGRLFNYECTVGAGTTAPMGLVTAAVASANVVIAGGSSTSGEMTTFTYADLVALEHAVDPAYRFTPTSKFMFSDAVLKGLKLDRKSTRLN